MDNLNRFSNNLINNNDYFQDEIAIGKIQQHLIMMGFDITMVNKIISFFKIRTVDEAINYLIKTEDGMWNHPFIPKEIINGENNNILQQPKIMVNSVIKKISGSINANVENNEPEQNDFKLDYKIENDICDICGELKEFHLIKDFNVNNNNNTNKINNFDLYNLNENNNLFNNNENNKIDLNDSKNERLDFLIDEIEDQKEDQKEDEKEDEKEEEKEEDVDPNKCLICLGDLDDPVEIEKCKHKFCYECFNSYLVNLINNNNIDKIPCPKNKCSNKELTEEFFSQYLSEQEYFKYRQFKSKNEIARDAKKFFCPFCNSYAQIEGNIEDYDSNNPNYKKTTLKCKNGHEFCSCGRPLHENECYHDDKEFKDLIANEQIKKCPKCGFLIKKLRGCNHMTCGNPACKYEFCWLCMNEAVPGHYEFGECAGRQFFDPDSLSFYLEQNYPILHNIYTFFAYVGLLLLFITSCFFIPGLGLSFASFILIFEERVLINIRNNYVEIIFFFTCVCISFCCQSIAYILWGIFISLVGIIISCLFLGFVAWLIGHIFKSCCSLCNSERNDSLINNEHDVIELANSFNE